MKEFFFCFSAFSLPAKTRDFFPFQINKQWLSWKISFHNVLFFSPFWDDLLPFFNIHFFSFQTRRMKKKGKIFFCWSQIPHHPRLKYRFFSLPWWEMFFYVLNLDFFLFCVLWRHYLVGMDFYYILTSGMNFKNWR